jgi:hypothetical protein
MRLVYTGENIITLKNNFQFSIFIIIIKILFLPILHIVFFFIVILIDYKIFALILIYVSSVFLEEYFHAVSINILYPFEGIYFSYHTLKMNKYLLSTFSFGVRIFFNASPLKQIYICLLGPLNAMFINILVATIIYLISNKLFYTFLIFGTLIPLLSLYPKKAPLISDGYRIKKLLSNNKIKLGKRFWQNLFLIECKLIRNIFK